MSIQSYFEQFHDANPGIYEEFVRVVFDGIDAGKTRMSAKFIFEFIRWHRPAARQYDLLNNNFTSRYARMFIADFPAYPDIFEIRELISK